MFNKLSYKEQHFEMSFLSATKNNKPSKIRKRLKVRFLSPPWILHNLFDCTITTVAVPSNHDKLLIESDFPKISPIPLASRRAQTKMFFSFAADPAGPVEAQQVQREEPWKAYSWEHFQTSESREEIHTYDRRPLEQNPWWDKQRGGDVIIRAEVPRRRPLPLQHLLERQPESAYHNQTSKSLITSCVF